MNAHDLQFRPLVESRRVFSEESRRAARWLSRGSKRLIRREVNVRQGLEPRAVIKWSLLSRGKLKWRKAQAGGLAVDLRQAGVGAGGSARALGAGAAVKRSFFRKERNVNLCNPMITLSRQITFKLPAVGKEYIYVTLTL